MKKVTSLWLSSICEKIPGTTCGVVFSATSSALSDPPLASWPEDLADIQFARSTLNTVLSLKKHVLLQQRITEQDTGELNIILAVPLYLYEELFGVAVIQITGRAQTAQQEAMRQLQQGAAWFEVLVKYHHLTHKKQLITAVDLLAGCLEYPHFLQAATETVTTLAIRLNCDRVSFGLRRDRMIKVEAISHSSDFDRTSSLLQAVREAMYEAVDQDAIIVYPDRGRNLLITRCHKSLSEEHGAGNVLTVPFENQGSLVGAMLFERPLDQPFDQTTVDHARQLTILLGPVLLMKHREEQPLSQTIRTSGKRFLSRITGPEKIGTKLFAAGAICCLLLLVLINGDYRISADARLEPQEQRVVVAPQNGFIAAANVRPGDIARKGDVICTLDDKDLQLESQKWSSQLNQLQKEYRQALARHDRSQLNIFRAKLQKAQAQLDLINEQLARVKLAAPFDGRIVSGDLSQSAGAPVERGEILFTMAPLSGHRIILLVEEQDIREIKTGQKGKLLLSGMADAPLAFTINKITPVSMFEEGRNLFQVEARLEEESDLLRPGMTGVAKINIEKRKLLWIVTRKLVNKLRLSFWSWKL